MNILIFAGGAGTRLWPLSRSASPKQFEILKDDTSTLQMAVERVKKFGLENVYISTNDSYIDLVKEQVPGIPNDHIMGEPARRDLAAAVGLALMRLKKQGVTGTVAMLWADHFMDYPDAFVTALDQANSLIQADSERFVFLGEQARFANHNLGWIHLEKNIESVSAEATPNKLEKLHKNNIEQNLYSFEGWKYRPDIVTCQEMYESGEWMWNPGYFVYDIDFVLELYKKHQPGMYIALEDMVVGEKDIATEYEKLDAISFDNAIVEKVDVSQAVVIKVDLGWSDPGTLYALKEAMVAEEKDNFEKGQVVDLDSRDSFIFNEEPEKLVATVGLEGMVVVNTKDATLVCHKDDVPRIKELLGKIKDQGLEKFL